MLLSALLGCWCSTRLRPLPRAPRTGLLWTAGLPGLEEGRAEWLTTSKFCFSVGLGWGIFPCLKISSPPFEEPLLKNFVVSLLILIRGTRTETAVGCSESCRPGVRC